MNSSWFLMLPLQNLQRCQRYPPMNSRPVLSQPEGQSLNEWLVLSYYGYGGRLRILVLFRHGYGGLLWTSWLFCHDHRGRSWTFTLLRNGRGAVSPRPWRIWVNFTRNGLRLESRHQEPPHTDVSRNLATVVIRGVSPGLRRRRTGLLPSGPKSSFQMRASFVFHLETKVPRVWRKGGEAHSPSCLKSSVKFPQSVMIWVQCHLHPKLKLITSMPRRI